MRRRGHRRSAASPRPRVLPSNRPSRRAAVISATGQERPYPHSDGDNTVDQQIQNQVAETSYWLKPGRGAKICRLGREDITWSVAYSLFLKRRENCDYSVRLLRDNMQCPVCDGSARDHTPPEFDGIVVGCATCGNYDIANKYLDKLRVLAPEVRREVLRKAKQFAKFARPSIDKRCF